MDPSAGERAMALQILPLEIFVAGLAVKASTSRSATDTKSTRDTGVLAARSTAAGGVAGRVWVAVGPCC